MKWATPIKVAIRNDFTFPSTTTQRLKRQGGGEFWTVGDTVIRWIEINCVLTAGHFAGQPFVLLPWQKRWLLELFETVKSGDEWRLKHRWATLGVGKKNGKSELIGALALFFLLGTDEVDPRIFVAASTEDQANMVFAPVKHMAEHSDTISPLVQSKARIVVSKSTRGGFVRRLAAVAGANDGANVYVALIDEFHEWNGTKGRNVWNVITNGTVMRREPMVIQITTAGYDEDTPCFEWYESGKAQMAGSVEDETAYFCWFEPDSPDDSHELEATWRRANPSFGLIMGPDFYADQLKRKTEATFRRYFCNQWTESEEIWDAAARWDDLKGDVVTRQDARTYVGIDIGRKVDTSAIAVVQMHDGVIHVTGRIWENPYGLKDSRRSEWRMNIDDITEFCREIRSNYPAASQWYDDNNGGRIPGPVFAYDPHLFGPHADKLADDGLNMIEFPQTDAHMVPASQILFEWIMGNKIVHEGDSTMRSHVRSVVAKTKERGWRISRPAGSAKHIDFAVALAMAVRLCVTNEVVETEVKTGEVSIW